MSLSPSPDVTCEAGEMLSFNCSYEEDRVLSDEDQDILVQWFINDVAVPASPPSGVRVNGSRLTLTCTNQTSVRCQVGDIQSNVTIVIVINGKLSTVVGCVLSCSYV